MLFAKFTYYSLGFHHHVQSKLVAICFVSIIFSQCSVHSFKDIRVITVCILGWERVGSAREKTAAEN